MKVELILLAAGQSKRFGGIKQLTKINKQPMILHCINQFRDKGTWIDELAHGYVILGSNALLIKNEIPINIDVYIANSWELGMGHSLAESISLLSSDTTHVLIALADQVLVTNELVKQLLQQAHQFPEKIIAAKYSDRLGAPSIFPRHYFSKLSQLTGDQGAKSLLQEFVANVAAIPMPEAAIDIDTLKDLESISL